MIERYKGLRINITNRRLRQMLKRRQQFKRENKEQLLSKLGDKEMIIGIITTEMGIIIVLQLLERNNQYNNKTNCAKTKEKVI